MVATIDIGRTAAELLRDTWSGVRLVELEGPRRYSARDIGTAFAAALGRDVRLDLSRVTPGKRSFAGKA
jgi:uncharacterized protein YbjT (DUF2867 family)